MAIRIGKSSAALGFLLVPFVLAGCTSGTREVEDWVKEAKTKRGARLEQVPEIKTFEKFEYTLKAPDDRDPFDAPPSAKDDERAADAGPKPDKNRIPEPLESFPLDGLKMVGTLGPAGTPEGLLKDPNGAIHRVHVGNYAGQNYGRITSINEGQIELVELVPNLTGGWDERQATISLANTDKK